ALARPTRIGVVLALAVFTVTLVPVALFPDGAGLPQWWPTAPSIAMALLFYALGLLGVLAIVAVLSLRSNSPASRSHRRHRSA
uniref:hypothetical protein n=1 Tax=Paracoccus seriniphilus TaxID=184748 RepID=UPI0035660463